MMFLHGVETVGACAVPFGHPQLWSQSDGECRCHCATAINLGNAPAVVHRSAADIPGGEALAAEGYRPGRAPERALRGRQRGVEAECGLRFSLRRGEAVHEALGICDDLDGGATVSQRDSARGGTRATIVAPLDAVLIEIVNAVRRRG